MSLKRKEKKKNLKPWIYLELQFQGYSKKSPQSDGVCGLEATHCVSGDSATLNHSNSALRIKKVFRHSGKSDNLQVITGDDFILMRNLVWCCISVMPVFRKLRQEDYGSRLSWTKSLDLSQNKNRNNHSGKFWPMPWWGQGGHNQEVTPGSEVYLGRPWQHWADSQGSISEERRPGTALGNLLFHAREAGPWKRLRERLCFPMHYENDREFNIFTKESWSL